MLEIGLGNNLLSATKTLFSLAAKTSCRTTLVFD